MTTVSVAAAASAPVDATANQSLASQNLFEHIAKNSSTMPHGASPADLARTVVNDLKGFVERSGKFANRAQETKGGATPQSFTNTSTEKSKPGNVEDERTTRAVNALAAVYDHTIETQVFIRGVMQVPTSANTLVKGS